MIEQEEQLPSKGQVLRFSVIDSGIGIPREKQALIFEAFSQADSSSTRAYGGTGLGLTISNQLITLMGGEISVRSVPGVGSVFTFTLPFNPSSSTRSTTDSNGQESLENSAVSESAVLNILLAEDNKVNQKLAVHLLKAAGHSVKTASDGLEAIELYEKENIDLILMDIQMPKLDGTEATKQIRAAEQNTDHHVPIIALTAHAMKGDREKYIECGMDGYVTKPIDRAKLMKEIQRLSPKSVYRPPGG